MSQYASPTGGGGLNNNATKRGGTMSNIIKTRVASVDGEFVVKAYKQHHADAGRVVREIPADYYTDDRPDAVATAKQMVCGAKYIDVDYGVALAWCDDQGDAWLIEHDPTGAERVELEFTSAALSLSAHQNGQDTATEHGVTWRTAPEWVVAAYVEHHAIGTQRMLDDVGV